MSWSIELLIEDYKCMLMGKKVTSITHIFREANQVVDALANLRVERK